MEEEGGKEYRWEAGYEKTWEAIQEDKEGLLDYSVQVGNCLCLSMPGSGFFRIRTVWYPCNAHESGFGFRPRGMLFTVYNIDGYWLVTSIVDPDQVDQ